MKHGSLKSEKKTGPINGKRSLADTAKPAEQNISTEIIYGIFSVLIDKIQKLEREKIKLEIELADKTPKLEQPKKEELKAAAPEDKDKLSKIEPTPVKTISHRDYRQALKGNLNKARQALAKLEKNSGDSKAQNSLNLALEMVDKDLEEYRTFFDKGAVKYLISEKTLRRFSRERNKITKQRDRLLASASGGTTKPATAEEVGKPTTSGKPTAKSDNKAYQYHLQRSLKQANEALASLRESSGDSEAQNSLNGALEVFDRDVEKYRISLGKSAVKYTISEATLNKFISERDGIAKESNKLAPAQQQKDEPMADVNKAKDSAEPAVVRDQPVGDDGGGAIQEESVIPKPGKFLLENQMEIAQRLLGELEKSNGTDRHVRADLDTMIKKIEKNLAPLKTTQTGGAFWRDVPKEIVDRVSDELKQLIQRRDLLTIDSNDLESTNDKVSSTTEENHPVNSSETNIADKSPELTLEKIQPETGSMPPGATLPETGSNGCYHYHLDRKEEAMLEKGRKHYSFTRVYRTDGNKLTDEELGIISDCISPREGLYCPSIYDARGKESEIFILHGRWKGLLQAVFRKKELDLDVESFESVWQKRTGLAPQKLKALQKLVTPG